jgi:hypothetical protein
MSPRLRLSLAALFCLCFLAPVKAADANNAGLALAPTTQPVGQGDVKFLRFIDDGHGGGRLETAIVTYRNDAGQTVRLVGAVHIGEKAYYQGLNDTFRRDDAVLYELVKPKDMVGAPQPNQPSHSAIGQFQHFLKDSLNLDFQLDDIDYSRPNFVHADLDAETFEKMQEERGESMFTLMLRSMMDAMSKGDAAGGVGDVDLADELIKMLCRPDSERQLKLLLARHMQDAEQMMSGLEGPKGSVILTERNKAALKVLADTLAKGKKNISVFYGAAHMPKMAETMTTEMGFRPVAVEYRTAWDLAIRADQPSVLEQFLRDAVKGLDE